MEQIRISIGYNKNLTVKRNGQYLNVYVNDNVFENGQLSQEKSKSVWLKWTESLSPKRRHHFRRGASDKFRGILFFDISYMHL